MEGYLGDKLIPVAQTPYAGYSKEDWILYWIGSYGQIDGSHHKQWLIDQVAQICNGVEIIIKQASWSNGQTEWRISLGDENDPYKKWVHQMKVNEDGEEEYDYDTGVAP